MGTPDEPYHVVVTRYWRPSKVALSPTVPAEIGVYYTGKKNARILSVGYGAARVFSFLPV